MRTEAELIELGLALEQAVKDQVGVEISFAHADLTIAVTIGQTFVDVILEHYRDRQTN